MLGGWSGNMQHPFHFHSARPGHSETAWGVNIAGKTVFLPYHGREYSIRENGTIWPVCAESAVKPQPTNLSAKLQPKTKPYRYRRSGHFTQVRVRRRTRSIRRSHHICLIFAVMAYFWRRRAFSAPLPMASPKTSYYGMK